jgi:hypothetical protein
MTQEIKPTYVTFEQAKWLKEKGYEIDTDEVLFCRDEINNIEEHQLKNRDVIYNATSINYKVGENEYRIYHQWEFVEWLRITHGIWVSVNIAMDDKWYFELYNLKDKRNAEIIIEDEVVIANVTDFHNSPQEAYSAAFDYILNNLI